MSSLPRRPTDVLRDALARLVVIREALEDGDVGYACAVAIDLEHDLAGALAWFSELRDAA
jgi:hypothetical protein